MALTLSSTAFKDGGPIPVQYTCDGADVSPPGATKQDVERAMGGHVIATTQLMGTYARKKR